MIVLVVVVVFGLLVIHVFADVELRKRRISFDEVDDEDDDLPAEHDSFDSWSTATTSSSSSPDTVFDSDDNNDNNNDNDDDDINHVRENANELDPSATSSLLSSDLSDESEGSAAHLVNFNKPSGNGDHVQGRFGAPVSEFAAWRDVDSDCADGSFSNLRSFVQFFGYPRSGHTLVAMLLDAHPDIVISNEYNLLEKWDKFETVHDMYMIILNKMLRRYDANAVPRAKKHAKNEAGHYNYRVPGAWQGRWRCLRVIGDKKGSSTTAGLQRNWEATLDKIAWIRNSTGLPVKFFHVIRNPYDNIATMITRSLNVRTHNATDHASTVADKWDSKWMTRVRRWIGLFETNMAYARTLPREDVLHVHDHMLLANATHETQRWCAFLGVECPPRYSAAVARILFRSPWKSRNRIPWSNTAKRLIARFMRGHELLRMYSFESEF
jgi:hypothetical protein